MTTYFGFCFRTGIAFTTAFAPAAAFVAHALENANDSVASAVRRCHGPSPRRSILNSGDEPIAAETEADARTAQRTIRLRFKRRLIQCPEITMQIDVFIFVYLPLTLWNCY